MICVPPLDQLIACLTDILTVGDGAGEDAWDVELVTENRVGAILNIERAIQGNSGRPNAKPFDLDSPAGATILNDLVTDFLDGLIYSAFHQACGT